MKEEGAHDRGALGGVFSHQRFGVRCQHGIDIHQPRQLRHAIFIIVILEVGVRAVASWVRITGMKAAISAQRRNTSLVRQLSNREV